MTYTTATATTKRRQPRVDNEVQRLQKKVAALELRMQQVVDDTNAWAKAREEWTNEQIRLGQQAQLEADQKVIDDIRQATEVEIKILRENFDIIFAENEALCARVAELERPVAQPKRKKAKARRQWEGRRGWELEEE